VRMVSVSLVFFGLYLGAVIALHQGLKPLNETFRLLRDLLPESIIWRRFQKAVPARREGPESRAELAVFSGDGESES
jgi:hypothetical protein